MKYPNWISIGQEPLPSKIKVLAVNKELDIAVVWKQDGEFIRGSWYGSCSYGCGGEDYFQNITHWMPLPELP